VKKRGRGRAEGVNDGVVGKMNKTLTRGEGLVSMLVGHASNAQLCAAELRTWLHVSRTRTRQLEKQDLEVLQAAYSRSIHSVESCPCPARRTGSS
jgi:hypothetical protein